jgi:hypothetical protein
MVIFLPPPAPPEWSEPAPGRSFDPGAHVSQAISALETAVAAMRERAEAAERAAQTERERADRAVAARDGERSRANALRDRIDALQASLAEAEAVLGDALRQTAEAEVIAGALRQSAVRWQSVGRLARLRWAWSGKTISREDTE